MNIESGIKHQAHFATPPRPGSSTRAFCRQTQSQIHPRALKALELSPFRKRIYNPHNHHNARPRKHATPATSRPTPKLRPRPLHRLHALERALRSQRLALSHCRRTIRIHGTRIPARRLAIPVESRTGYTGWGDCGVQCEGEGYSDCASSC